MFGIFYLFSDWALLVARIVLAIVFLAHGFPKLKNLKGTGEWMASVGFKPGVFWALVAGVAEFFGGILLLGGFCTQTVAFVLTLQFIVIVIWKIVARHKFVGDLELDLVLLALLLMLLTSGGGVFSFDRWAF